MKNLRKETFAALLVMFTVLAGCAETMPESADEGAPPDAEFGLETQDERADSFAVRPGSEEAKTVLRLVNQPLADDAAGQAFVVLLDSELHKRAAYNIGDFRAGRDGVFGTADDQTFDTLVDVDAIRYVGRVALMQLHTLALAEGFGAPPKVNCSEHFEIRYGRISINDYEDMLALEESGCTIVDASLAVDLTRQYLPPSARTFDAFANIVEVEGRLHVGVHADYIDEVNFASLEKVRELTVFSRGGEVAANFPSLKTSEFVQLHGLIVADLNALETVGDIQVEQHTDHPHGFNSLREADSIQIELHGNSALNASFPSLTTIEDLTLRNEGDGVRLSQPEFPVLESAKNINLMKLGLENAPGFPSLKTVTNSLYISKCDEALAPFAALEIAASINLDQLTFQSTGVHGGFDSLQAVDYLRIYRNDTDIVLGYENLQSAGDIVVTHNGGGTFEGFNALASVNRLSLEVRNAELGGFGQLEEVAQSLRVRAKVLDALPSLELVGGGATIYLADAATELPSLSLVGGGLTLYSRNGFDGFDSVAIVEGDLQLLGNSTSLTGLRGLEGVGGDMVVGDEIPHTDLDRLLNQLTEFSGRISFR